MIDGSPRPLPRRRLAQLIHGLQTRFRSSANQLSVEISGLTNRLAVLNTEHDAGLVELETARKSQREACTLEWDELLLARWDDAEMRSFKAVFDTAQREGNLRRTARQNVEQLNVEIKKRAAEIEKTFLRAKDVPIKRLNDFRTEAKELESQIHAIEQAAEAALVQRSLRVPEPNPHSPENLHAPDSNAAKQQLQAIIADARAACDRLTNHAMAKFFESAAWWAICAVLFVGIAAALGLSGATQWLVAALIAAGVTVLAIIITLVGIRPWLKRFASAEYPKVQRSVQLGRQVYQLALQLAVTENDNELKRLAAKRDERFEQAKEWREQQVRELTEKLESDLSTLKAGAQHQKNLASQQLTQAIAECDTVFTKRLQQEWQKSSTERDALIAKTENHRVALKSEVDRLHRGGALRMQIATQKAVHIISRSRRWCNEVFPEWEQLRATKEHWPSSLNEPVLPLGMLGIADLLPDNVKQDIGGPQLQAPLLFAPLRDEYLTITAEANTPAIHDLIRNLVMRALTTLPPGKTQVCVIDPPGLGREFGWLMHLSDYDPQLVSHRVWTQPGHISKQLSSLAMAAEDFIQQSLRNQYRDIVDYNADAAALSEPYRLLVWSSFPSGLDDQSWKSLQSLLDTGARCGIIPILLIDPSLTWPNPEMREVISRRGMHLNYDSAQRELRANDKVIDQFAISPVASASEEQSQQIIQEVGRRALQSSRVEVPLARMIPSPKHRWQADSTRALEIPIGQSGVGRVHSLKLGLGTAQHAIVAGKTGSGKSSLLHAIITSAALKYSPDNLRLILLDFKKGVEFQVYSNSGLPHADIIGIESHREFGLSTLEYIDSCMQRRGEAFRQAAVQDIASWNTANPEQSMPRMLLVIDEFQELFVEDDKLSNQASLILDRIVRQGRSFGVHALLSSQTLAGAYSLPRTTLGQMAVRIALQCDSADAQIIFADDNPAAARLKHPGQAVYNDAGGRFEGNQPMQIGWLSKEQQVEWLRDLPVGYQNRDATTNRLGRCIVYDGNRAATWNAANADLATQQYRRELNSDAIWCITGESVAISPAVAFPLTRQAGRNALIVGGQDPAAATLLTAIAASVVGATNTQTRPQLFVVQGAKPTDACVLKLPALWHQLNCELHTFDVRGADAAVQQVFDLLKQRIDSAATAPAQGCESIVLLQLLQLGRLRSLRRDDDFSNFGSTEITPDKQLEEILRDGPSHGIFTVAWAESYSTVSRWLSRTALRELEIRLLMQMSGNDSTNLIDSIAGSRLGEHVMLVFDEATGQEQKFRSFERDSLSDIVAWANQPE